MRLLDKIDTYLEDYLTLTNLSKNYAPLLRELIESQNLEGYILINSALKRLLSERLDIAVGSIENAITRFVDEEVLVRVDRGMYVADKDMVDIRSLKEGQDIKVYINYSDNGKKIKSGLQRSDKFDGRTKD